MLISNVDIRIEQNIREDENFTIQFEKDNVNFQFEIEDKFTGMKMMYAIEELKIRCDQEEEEIWLQQEKEYIQDKRLRE